MAVGLNGSLWAGAMVPRGSLDRRFVKDGSLRLREFDLGPRSKLSLPQDLATRRLCSPLSPIVEVVVPVVTNVIIGCRAVTKGVQTPN